MVAALLAGSVLASRVLGFVREAVLADRLGTGPAADAYRAAFQIPDILNHLLAGGAFALAFVPIYSRFRETRGEESARRLLATVLGSMTVLTLIVTGALWVFSEPLIAWLFAEFTPENQALTARLTRIVLPAQVGFVTGGVVRAALMASDRFWTQAAGPLVYNLGIIAGGLLLAPKLGAEGFAWGALAGALLGPLILPLFDAGRSGLRLGFRVAPWDRDFGAYLWRAAPLILGLSVLTVDEWYDRYFGQFAGEGAIAALGYARIVMVVPVALLGQAVATAMLPALSQLWSQGRGEDFDRALLMALRAAVGLALMAAAGMIALAEPTVALLYQRGAFTAEDSLRVASLLSVFAFAVPGMVALQLAGRGFFAREDMWRPMLLGTAVAAGAIPLYAVVGRAFGAEGLAASGAVTMTANAVLLLLLLRRVHGGPPLAPLLGTLARSVLLAALAGAASGWAEGFGESPLGRLLLGGATFMMVAISGIYVLGDDAMREVTTKLAARLRRRRGSA